MGRPSKKDRIIEAVDEYLTKAICESPDEYSIDAKTISEVVNCSRASIYNYGLQDKIREASDKQAKFYKRNGGSGKRTLHDIIDDLRVEIKRVETHNLNLLERLNLVEANAERLGIDPEELYKPVMTPSRLTPRTGRKRLVK